MATREILRSYSLPTVFDDIFNPFNELITTRLPQRLITIPAVNVTEDDKGYTISLAAPGLNKEDFNIDVDTEANVLSISAEKEVSSESEEEENFTRQEYNYSSFSRSFALPEDVQLDGIEAWYENGVLYLNLPRKEEKTFTATKQQIAVQ